MRCVCVCQRLNSCLRQCLKCVCACVPQCVCACVRACMQENPTARRATQTSPRHPPHTHTHTHTYTHTTATATDPQPQNTKPPLHPTPNPTPTRKSSSRRERACATHCGLTCTAHARGKRPALIVCTCDRDGESSLRTTFQIALEQKARCATHT
jgi:hypothetical protein